MADENQTGDVAPAVPKPDVISAKPVSAESQSPISSTPNAKTVDPIAATPNPQERPAAPGPEDSGPTATNYAGFWIRFAAALIDGVILAITGSIIQAIFGGLIGASLLTTQSTDPAASAGLFAGLFGAAFLLNIAIQIAYFVGLTGAYGATLGKMVFGLKVVGTDGQKIGFGKAALREIVGKWISGLVFGLGYLWVAFDEKKQGWHDKLANTFVIKTR